MNDNVIVMTALMKYLLQLKLEGKNEPLQDRIRLIMKNIKTK